MRNIKSKIGKKKLTTSRKMDLGMVLEFGNMQSREIVACAETAPTQSEAKFEKMILEEYLRLLKTIE